jgi:hypothetical protein
VKLAKATRLYYATETTNGELGRLKAVSFTGPQYATVGSMLGVRDYIRQLDAGELLFELEYEEPSWGALVSIFNKTQQVEWTIEMPNGYTWGFKGFVSEVESTIGMVHACKVKVKVSGPVTCYREVEYVADDNTPTFTKAASKAQAITYGRMLEMITRPPAPASPLSGYVEGDYVEPVEYEEYEEYED